MLTHKLVYFMSDVVDISTNFKNIYLIILLK